jgi:hypothetical protein
MRWHDLRFLAKSVLKRYKSPTLAVCRIDADIYGVIDKV